MSKLDIGVGDEFPLDEPRNNTEGRRGERHWHHRHGHHHHRRGPHGHHHHRHHGFGKLGFLLMAAGIVALIVNHQLTAPIAWGLVAVGGGLWAVMVLIHLVWHWRHRNTSQVS
jgi:hypothetical protein